MRTVYACCTDGTVQSEDCLLLELEDVAQSYKRPSIIDIKVCLVTLVIPVTLVAGCSAGKPSGKQDTSRLNLSHAVLQVGFKTWYPGSDERYIAKCQCVFCSSLSCSTSDWHASFASSLPCSAQHVCFGAE